MPIPLVDVKAQYAPLMEELRALRRRARIGRVHPRPNFYAFEEEAATYLGVERTIGVANGTDALVLVLDALEIGPGDEVICPAFTFYATAESIARRGATPVFADIDPATLNLDPEDVAAKGDLADEGDHARAPVRPARRGRRARRARRPADRGRRPGVRLAGHRDERRSTFSFYPTKNLFCLGDGARRAQRRRARRARAHARVPRLARQERLPVRRLQPRLDELQAAFLRLFLQHLDEWTRGAEAAARYAELGLGELVEPPVDEPGHVYHLFVCRSFERDAIRAALREAEIASATYYTTPLHLQPALRFLGWEPGSLPETSARRRRTSRCRSGPMASAVQERVVDVVRSAVGVSV